MDDTNKTTIVADANDVQQNKVMAILAYIYILFLVPLLSESAKKSPFARYHTNQGIWLFIISLVINLIGGITVCLLPVTMLAHVVYIVLGIINANKGEMKPLPGFAILPAIIK